MTAEATWPELAPGTAWPDPVDIYAHRAQLRRVAERVLNDGHAAEDVVQEVVLYAWTNPGRFDAGRGSLLGWLTVITRRRALDRLRQDAARSAREIEVIRDRERAGTDDDALAAVLLRSLIDSIAQLPPEQAKVLTLSYVAGWTHREIADGLGLPLGTVKSRLRLGVARLVAALAPDRRECC